MAAKSFVVFGLGKFGYSVATTLAQNGYEILAVDMKEELVEEIAGDVTMAVKANVKDAAIYSSLGLSNMDGAVIAISEDMEASIMATVFSVEAGIPYIMAKASSETHVKILEKLGADRVVLPEKEMGSRIARNLVFGKFVDTFELSATYSMVEMEVPDDWVGKTLRSMDVRNKYGVNVIAVKDGDDISTNMDPDEPLKNHQIILTVGNNERLKKIR